MGSIVKEPKKHPEGLTRAAIFLFGESKEERPMAKTSSTIAANVGLVCVTILSAWLIYKMIMFLRSEGFEALYSGAKPRAGGGAFASAEFYSPLLDKDETYEEVEEFEEDGVAEPFAELSEVGEAFQTWGDGTQIVGTEKFSTLLVEPAYYSEDANALFSPEL
jgi:hypothetical protein